MYMGEVASSSVTHGDNHNDSHGLNYEDRPSTRTQTHITQSTSSSSTTFNPRHTFSIRRYNNYVRRHISPLDSGFWISVELVVNVSQIIAAIVVLSLSRHEHPQAPLFALVIGYTAGCIATLPHLYWRYIHSNSQLPEQEAEHARLGSQQNSTPEPSPYTAISITQASEGESNLLLTAAVPWFGQNVVLTSPRFNVLLDHFKMALDCFFALWFVVANVWIFGGHSSPSSSPNLYMLCIGFLAFSCIGYVMPFMVCATICCCLPCILSSAMGFTDGVGQTRGANMEPTDARATLESVNVLPTYKFKEQRTRNGEVSETDSENPGEGGILAIGTDKERIISAEDAVCCICLARYLDNESLRELPCTHFFHMECVDKWLKINAWCPLCKS